VIARRCAIVAALLAACVAGCGGGDAEPPATTPADPPPPRADRPIERDADNASRELTVGALNFPSQQLLGELYAQALRAAGFRTRVDASFGSEQAALAALRAGRVEALPEYLAAVLTVLGEEVPHTKGEAYAAVREALQKRDAVALPPADAEDAPGFAMRRGDAGGAHDLSDLRARAPRLVLACPPRDDCGRPLQRAYGLRFRRVIRVPVADRYAVLDDERADVSAVFTGDGALAGDDYTLLADDRDALAPYHVTLVVRVGAEEGVPEVVERLQSTLTLPVLQRLNRRVDGGAAPARVAASHLRAAGLVR
jgi:glycine betaine/choline ABC-type transport system substrate-binding protein